MPNGTITSTENTFGTVNGALSGTVAGTLTGSVGVPGPVGPQGQQGIQGPPGPPGVGGAWGSIVGTLSAQTDLWTELGTKYLASNPAGYQTAAQVSSALSPYLLSSTASATYQTLAGMSSYLTTSAAAAGYYPLTGNPSSFLTASALTGYATQSWVSAGFAPLARALPSAGTTGQVLTKNSGSDYDASWATFIPGDRYLTTSSTSNTIGNGTKTFTVGTGLSYTTQQDIVIAYDATNHMHALVTSYDSGTGVLVADVQHHSGSGTYTSWTVNVGGTTPLQSVEWGEILGTLGDQTDLATALNAKLETTTAASTYAPIASPTFTGTVTIPAGASISGFAPLASPALTGTPTSTTAAADTNTTQIATTAFVVGQAGSAAPVVNGTAAAGTSLRYARQDHVHPTDTSRAALASPTFTGVPAAPTAAVDTNTTQLATTAYVVGQGYLKSATASTTYAPLASAALTGVPTAPTATAGTNTTQLATTAFVTAAVPAFAATTNVIFDPSSTTLALNPALIPQFLANSNYRNYSSLTQTSVSGSASFTQFGSARELYTTSTTVSGRATFMNGLYSASFIGLSSKSNSNIIDWSKKIWVFGTAILGRSTYLGNANTVTRINLGGRSTNATGNLTSRGIGLFKVGGTSTFITLTVHNGTTLTNVASSVTLASDATVHYVIYSDGAGNVQLYLDGTLAASTTAGPTGSGTSGHNIYEEQIESATSSGALASMHIAGAGIYMSR